MRISDWSSDVCSSDLRLFGSRYLPVPRQGAVDPASPSRQRKPAAGGPVDPDQLPEAGWRGDLRPAVLGVPVEHQPRGEPAGAPHAEGCVDPGRLQSADLRRSGAARSEEHTSELQSLMRISYAA